MSRLPSSLERGRPMDPFPLTRAPGVLVRDRPGFGQSLDVPGAVPLPPLVAGGRSPAEQLLGALDLIGDAAGMAGRFAHQETSIRKEKAEEIRVAQQGLARRDAAMDAIEMSKAVKERKLLAPEGVPVSEWALQMARERADSFSEDPSYREAYINSLAPHLASTVVGEQLVMQEEAKKSLGQTFQDAAVHATTTDDILAAERAALKLGYAPEEAAWITGGASLMTAAKTGDRARFEAAKAALGGRFPDKQAEADIVYQRVIEQKQRDRNDLIENEIKGQLNDGVPPSAVRENIRKHVKGHQIDEKEAFGLLNIVDSIESQQNAALRKQQGQAAEDQIRSWQKAVVKQLGDSGMLHRLSDITMDVDNPVTGSKVAFNKHDAEQEYIRDRFAQVQAKFGDDPAKVMSEQIRAAVESGVTPDSWRATLSAGANASQVWSLADSPEKQTPPPPATIEGFRLYRMLKSNAQGMEKSLTSEQDKDFYDLAGWFLESPESAGDEQKALLNARLVMGRGGAIDEKSKREIMDKAEEIGNQPGWIGANTGTVGNLGYLQSRVVRELVKARIGGVTTDAAFERVAEDIRKDTAFVNNWAIPTRSAGYGPDAYDPDTRKGWLPDTLRRWVGEFSSANAQKLTDAGFDPSALSVDWDENARAWFIVDTRMGTPIALPGAVMDRNELAAMRAKAEAQKGLLPTPPKPVRDIPMTPAQKKAVKEMEDQFGLPPSSRQGI